MSLLNDVLRDLERRRQSGGSRPVAGVRPVMARHGGYARWLLVALPLAGGAAIAGGVYGWPGKAEPPEPQMQVARLEHAPAALEPLERPNSVHGIGFAGNDDELRWQLKLERAVAHTSRYQREQRRLTVRLPDTHLSAALPPAALADARVALLDLGQDGADVVLTVEFAGPARVLTSLHHADAGPMLVVEARVEPPPRPAAALEPPTAAKPAAGTAGKVETKPAAVPVRVPEAAVLAQAPREPAPPTEFRRSAADDGAAGAERDYRAALQSLREGRTRQAVERLRQLLSQAPDHHAARETLVSVILEHQGVAAARAELAPAVERWPTRSGYAQLYARLLLEEGAAAQALLVLERAVPAAMGDGAYHALLAATYQRLERNAQAQAIYRELVRRYPQQGLWWLGLAVAAEAQGEAQEALAGYRQALGASGLDRELQRFAQERVRELSGSSS